MKKSTAIIYNFAAILCWSVSPIMIRSVSGYFSVSFQNFFRFAVSIVILWIFTLAAAGRTRTISSIRGIRRPVRRLPLIALANFSHQFFLIKGVYLLLPGLVTIIEESTVIFAAVLAFIFIPEERSVIRQPRLIVGMLIAVAGVLLTALPEVVSRGSSPQAFPAAGVMCIIISSFSWALFSLLIRLWLPDTPAPVTSSLIFTLVIPFFIVSMLFEGSVAAPVASSVPASAWIQLGVSGVIGIGLGYSFYYQAIKGLGVTMTSSLGLGIPLVTMLISFIVFGERLLPVQAAGTAALLAGSFMLIRTRFD